MLSILINAYACSPNMGSEPGMAWNWCTNLAQYCELHIITEGEFRDKIEAVLPTLPQGKNIHFHYNPVSGEIRKMCWNQGDWRFYKYYKEWQWKTYEIAKEIKEKWTNVNYGAVPYLNAMCQLVSIDDNYHLDTGRDIVNYFLSNASTWRGEDARRIKKELNDILKGK